MLKLKNIYSKHIFYLIIFLSAMLVLSFFTVEAKTVETGEKAQDAQEGSINTEVKERKYIYNPEGKTDPFKSFIVVQEESKEKTKEKPRTYLETLELSQLTLSVVVLGEKDRWAMVTDNKGDGHVIKEGTPIGLNGGFVYKIQQGEVIIREEYKNVLNGEKEFRDVSKKTPSER